MALGTPVAGTAAYSAASGTSVAPAYPAGILSTDAVLLLVGQKPTTANGGTVTTPAGWTLRGQLLAAGGYGTTIGADVGNTNLYVYSWNSPINGQGGTLTVTVGDNNVSWAFIVRIPTGGGLLGYGEADGQRITTPTSPMTIALADGSPSTAFQAGDMALWAMCIPTDVTTPSQFSAQSISNPGVSFGSAIELNEPDSGNGNDIGGYSAYASVTAGVSTGAPSVTTTLAGTLTNVRGPVVLVRIREAAVTHATSGTLSGQGASIVGAASRTAQHATSGTLTGQATTVTGASARTRAHATSGLLDGQGADVVGSASRAGAPVSHATSGALAGQGADAAGLASRFRLHSTDGILQTNSAEVTGTAESVTVHATTGSLIGAGSAIVGLATNGSPSPTAGTGSGFVTAFARTFAA